MTLDPVKISIINWQPLKWQMQNDKCKIVVGEPWEFRSPSGDNVIVGRILSRKDPRYILFVSDEEIYASGHRGKLFVLERRDLNIYFDRDRKNFPSCQISIIPNENLEDGTSTLSLSRLQEISFYVLLGSLEVIPEERRFGIIEKLCGSLASKSSRSNDFATHE